MAEAFQLLDSNRRESGGLRAMMKDSSYVTLRSREPSVTRASHPRRAVAWKATLWRINPLLGLTALLLAAGCIAASYWILQESNGDPVYEWDITPPSVYLSVATNATNILIRFAFGLALPLAWWRSAIRGSTLASLHSQWASGTSLYRALTSTITRRRFGPVALAAIATSLIAVSGPLLQKASFVVPQIPSGPVGFEFMIAPELPRAWAGNWTGPEWFTDRRMSDALISFLGREDMRYASKGSPCPGTCVATVHGPGLAKTCTTTTQSYDPNDPTTLPLFRAEEYLVFAVKFINFNGMSTNSSLWFGPNNIVEPADIPLPDLTRELAIVEIVFANNDGASPPTVSATQCWVESAILEYTIVVNGSKTVRFASPPSNLPVIALANNTLPLNHSGNYNQSGNSVTHNSIVNVLLNNAAGVFRTDCHRDSNGTWIVSALNAFGISHVVRFHDKASGVKTINPLDDLMASLR